MPEDFSLKKKEMNGDSKKMSKEDQEIIDELSQETYDYWIDNGLPEEKAKFWSDRERKRLEKYYQEEALLEFAS